MIIGITGKSAGGKSTLANYLSERLPNLKIISVDEFYINLLLENLDELKKLYGEDIFKDGELDHVLFLQYPKQMKIISDLVEEDLINALLKEIKDNEKKYNFIIVDFYRLVELQEIWNYCNYRILVEPENNKKRYHHLCLRHIKSNIPVARGLEEEFSLRDYTIPNYSNYSYDFTLVNKYDESLKREADLIAAELK